MRKAGYTFDDSRVSGEKVVVFIKYTKKFFVCQLSVMDLDPYGRFWETYRMDRGR